MEKKYTAKQIMNAIRDNDNCIIDDHTDNNRKCIGFVVLANGHICEIFEEQIFCLNAMYIADDGKPHISRWSVAGNVDHKFKSMSKRIELYNQGIRFKGNRVTELHRVQ